MRAGSIDLTTLTTRRAPFTDALQIYQHLMGDGGSAEAGVILEYGQRDAEIPRPAATPTT